MIEIWIMWSRVVYTTNTYYSRRLLAIYHFVYILCILSKIYRMNNFSKLNNFQTNFLSKNHHNFLHEIIAVKAGSCTSELWLSHFIVMSFKNNIWASGHWIFICRKKNWHTLFHNSLIGLRFIYGANHFYMRRP